MITLRSASPSPSRYPSASPQSSSQTIFSKRILNPTLLPLENNQSCDDRQASCPTGGLSCSEFYVGPSCPSQPSRSMPTYKAVVMLIVDALRFDFAPEHPTIAALLEQRPR
jgi:hypothetical protein